MARAARAALGLLRADLRAPAGTHQASAGHGDQSHYLLCDAGGAGASTSHIPPCAFLEPALHYFLIPPLYTPTFRYGLA